MTQLDFQNKVSNLKQYIEAEYQLLAKQAALQVSAIRGGVEQVILQIGESAEAIIETKIGTIQFNGQPVASTPQYEAIIAALHRALGEQPVVNANPAPQTPPATVTATATVTTAQTTETATATAEPTPEVHPAEVQAPAVTEAPPAA